MENENFREVEAALPVLWDKAKEFGLDPFPVHFEMVPAAIMYEFGAYGLPGRFSHWTFGKSYHQIKTMYDYGLSKIYELVINANPASAFLLENNSVLQNKVVAAHVLAHSDFFKNNIYFAHTHRHMDEIAVLVATRISEYEYTHGKNEVEKFLDDVLSIQEHFDPNVRIRRETEEDREKRIKADEGFIKTEFDDLFYLGPDKRPEKKVDPKKFPPEPEKDLLFFIAENAKGLEDWQRDVLHIVRNEQIYFLPQMQTKLMNEGWAAYWHARIIRDLDLTTDEFLEFATMHAGVLEPSRRGINPYFVGMKIFEDIEKRWDEPSDEDKEKFGRPGGEGKKKIFEVREMESDVSFLRNYMTKELVEDLDLYLYRLENNKWVVVEKDWEKVRDNIVTSMTNFGQPYIVVEDGDYSKNGELYLKHLIEGRELDRGYADKTLRGVQRLWGRKVHLETVLDAKPIVLSFDGTSASNRTP